MTERPVARRSPAPQGLSPSGLLGLQRSAGNQAVTRALTTRPTLARWRDFVRARGTPRSDYKIVEGNHEAAGKYHIKFHNVERLDAFDEIHVVFEAKAPPAYFFYTDEGALINEKSASGLSHHGLEAIARAIVDEQLATSNLVPPETIAARRKERAEQKAKDAEKKKQYKAEAEAEYEAIAARQAERREESKSVADEEQHVLNFLKDQSLGDGEKGAFMLYLDSKGPARSYWKQKADWYLEKRNSGWKIVLPSQRVKKNERITPDKVRTQHSLPKRDEIKVTISSSKSGRDHFNDSAQITFANYTLYAASALAEKPPT